MGILKGYKIYTNLSTRQLDLSTGQLDNFNEILQLIEAIARHFRANQNLNQRKIGRETAWRVQMTPNAFRPAIKLRARN